LRGYVDDMALDPARMLADDSYAGLLGMELRDDDPIELAMTVRPEHQNFLGVTHGGAMFSLADCAFALASNRAGARAVAIDTHLVLTGGSSEGDVLTAVAEETTRGRTLATYRIVVRRNDDRIVGLFTGTVHISS
jgi:acyl-CoA thioesterase